jgi:hypothetical protein
MDPIASRVASRYLESAFIPDKLWKEELSTLKKLMLETVSGPYEVASAIQNNLIQFFDKFLERIKATGMHHHAVTSVQNRIEPIKKTIEDRASSFNDLGREMYTYDQIRSLEDDLVFRIGMELKDYFHSHIPTVGKALQLSWGMKPGSVRALAARLLIKATPEERKALQLSVDDIYNDYYSRLRYQFFDRVNLKGLAVRLITKAKAPIDLTKVFERIKSVLEANYTQENLRGFDDFSVGGMKIIVLNPDIWVVESSEYAKRVIEARSVLNRKGFSKLWYGVLFIVDKKFEKLSPEAQAQYNELGYKSLESTAGTYHSGADVIRITEHYDDPQLIGTIVHEMGHRYWYKFMKPDQRARFNDLVRTNPSKETRGLPSGPTDESGQEKPVTPVSDYGASTIEEAFAEAFEHYCDERDMNRDQLESFRSVLSSDEDPIVQAVARRVLAERSKKVPLGYQAVNIRTGQPLSEIFSKREPARAAVKVLLSQGLNAGVQTLEAYVPSSWKRGDSLEPYVTPEVFEALKHKK